MVTAGGGKLVLTPPADLLLNLCPTLCSTTEHPPPGTCAPQDPDTHPSIARVEQGGAWWVQRGSPRLIPTDPVFCQVMQDLATDSPA